MKRTLGDVVAESIAFAAGFFQPIPETTRQPVVRFEPAPQLASADPVNLCWCGFCGERPCACFSREAEGA